MYKADVQLCRNDEDLVLDQVVLDMKSLQDSVPHTLQDFTHLPLITKAQIDTAKAHFVQLPYGIHLWNKSVIDKRRYELIEPVSVDLCYTKSNFIFRRMHQRLLSPKKSKKVANL